MKKLALIMLVVISMGLVSCGGKSSNGGNEIRLADPPITYLETKSNSRVELHGCLKVQNLDVKEVGTNEIKITGKIEIVKEPAHKVYNGYWSGYLELLDANGEMLVCAEAFLEEVEGKVGDIGKVDVSINTGDAPASEIMAKAKFVRFADAVGLRQGD